MELAVAASGGDAFVQAFAHELFNAHVQMPWQDKIIATARGIQLTGMFICVATQRPLDQCACYQDLCRCETEAAVEKIIVAGAEDWSGLATQVLNTRFPTQ